MRIRDGAIVPWLLLAACDEADPEPRDAAPGLDAGDDAGLDGAAPRDAQVADDAAVDAGPDEPVDPLAGIGVVELVEEGFGFLEGPQWRAVEGVLLFTDIDGDTIHELTPPSAIRPFRSPSGRANGLALDPEGRLLAAEHANRRVSRTSDDGTVETLVGSWNGMRLNSPNDIAVRSDGQVYFTDPPYG